TGKGLGELSLTGLPRRPASAPHTQSRHSIRSGSANWLGCFTRKHERHVNSPGRLGATPRLAERSSAGRPSSKSSSSSSSSRPAPPSSLSGSSSSSSATSSSSSMAASSTSSSTSTSRSTSSSSRASSSSSSSSSSSNSSASNSSSTVPSWCFGGGEPSRAA